MKRMGFKKDFIIFVGVSILQQDFYYRSEELVWMQAFAALPNYKPPTRQTRSALHRSNQYE